MEGQGLGSRLVREALTGLRDRGVAVLPYCPFVKAYLQRHPELVDLVPEAERAALRPVSRRNPARAAGVGDCTCTPDEGRPCQPPPP